MRQTSERLIFLISFLCLPEITHMMYLNISCVVDETSVQQVGLPCEVFHLLGPLQVLRQGTRGSNHRDWALNSQFLHENTNHTLEKLEKRLLHIYLNRAALFRRCYQKAALCQLWNSQVDGFLFKHKIIVENRSPTTTSATLNSYSTPGAGFFDLCGKRQSVSKGDAKQFLKPPKTKL